MKLLNVIQHRTTFTDETDADLFTYMSWKNEYPEEAKRAFAEFHERYGKYLLKMCYKVCRSNGHLSTLAEDIFQNTLCLIYDKAGTFKSQGVTDPGELRKLVRAWITRIAINEFYQAIRGDLNNTNLQLVDTSEYEKVEEEVPPEKIMSPESKLIEEALTQLKPREREVLLTYFKYSQANKYLPHNIIDELCKTFDTTPTNIRKIKSRALAEVQRYCGSKIKQN